MATTKRRKPRPGPAKGAANAGRPPRTGQVVVQLRASVRAVAAFDDYCDRVFKACRTDVLRWWIDDTAEALVGGLADPPDAGDEMRLTLRLPAAVAERLQQVATERGQDASSILRGGLAAAVAGFWVPSHFLALVDP